MVKKSLTYKDLQKMVDDIRKESRSRNLPISGVSQDYYDRIKALGEKK